MALSQDGFEFEPKRLGPIFKPKHINFRKKDVIFKQTHIILKQKHVMFEQKAVTS